MLDRSLWNRALDTPHSAAGFREYIERLPNGIHARQAADTVAWADAEKEGTAVAIRGYLFEYPDGEYAEQAREVLEEITNPAHAHVSRVLPPWPACMGACNTQATRGMARACRWAKRPDLNGCRLWVTR